MSTYRLHGTAIESSVPLHERTGAGPARFRFDVEPPRAVPDDEPVGANLMRYYGPGRRSMTITRTEDGHDVIRFHEMAEFDLDRSDGRIRARIDPAVDPGMLPILLTGNVLNHVFVSEGDPVLHASAIRYEGRTIAFLARPGGGKSTLTAVACAAGAELVGDDLLRLDRSDVRICHTGSSAIRVRSGVADHVLSAFGNDVSRRETADGRIAVSPPTLTDERTRLDAIIVPVLEHDGGEIKAEPLSPALAAQVLLALPRMGSWTDPGIITSVFDSAAAVATAIPMFRAEVPWNSLPNAELVEELLRKTA